MIRIYKTINGKLEQLQKIEENCWIRMTDPTPQEVEQISQRFNIDEDYLTAALDRQETSRVEQDESSGWSLITFNAPCPDPNSDDLLYQTVPVGILENKYGIITVAVQPMSELDDIVKGEKVKHPITFLHTRFILQILYRITENFVYYLREINKKSNAVERKLHSSLDNKQLYEMLDLEKSTVFFSTALHSNYLVVDKLERGRVLKLYPDDDDLLEDILIEIEQANSMCKTYSDILSGTMDAFASIISNNLNVVMKILTAITTLITIPTLVFSFYGMNIAGLPVPSICPVSIITAIFTLGGFLVLYKLNMFR